ncbi:MAG TPA: hypothetical protein VN813_07310, partial [Luteibacter sp.]|nr:hypothetical protein [Luteibacter sp.]
MSTFFAEPSTLCAYCAADPGGDFLAKGTHLRVLPSRMLGLPLMPFVAMPVNVLDIREKLFVWGDDPVPEMGADLDAAGGEVTGYLPKPLSGGRRVIGVEVVFVSGGSGSVAVIDTTDDRLITRRSTAPYRVGAPCIERVRVRGRGIFTLIAYVVQPEALAHALLGARAYPQRFGLPLEGRYPWYVAGEGEAAAWERVAGGGPLTLTRADLPDGPFPELSDPLAVERSRVLAFSGDLTADAKLLVGDERVPPSHVVAVTTIPARVIGTARQPWQRLVSNIRDNLLMKSLDPGAGRYLGLMAWFNELPGNARSAWLTAGVFVCRTGADPDARRDALPLPPPDPLEGSLLRHFIDLYPELDDIARRAGEGQREGWWLGVCDGKRDAYRLQLRVFATAALAVPTPDAPDAPDVSPGHAEWIAEASVASARFRQSFLVRSAPLSCLVAMGRLQGQWVTRHEIQSLDSGANPAVRAAPMFLASRNALSDGASSLISDSDISVVGVPWRYRFALGDVFGR